MHPVAWPGSTFLMIFSPHHPRHRLGQSEEVVGGDRNQPLAAVSGRLLEGHARAETARPLGQ